MKILTVLGDRPQFIKAATFDKFLLNSDKFIQEIYGKDDTSEKIINNLIEKIKVD